MTEVDATWPRHRGERPARGRPAWLGRVVVLTGTLWLTLLAGFAVYYHIDQQSRDQPPGRTALIQEIRKAEEAVRLNPTSGAARIAVADLYNEAGQYQAAAEQYQQALNLDGRNLPAANGLAAAYMRLGHLDDAASLLKRVVADSQALKVLRTSGDMAEARLRLGQIYLLQGKTAEATAEAQAALAIAPADADVLLLVGQARAREGDLAAAVSQYRKALRLVPKFPEAYESLAAAYEGLGDRPRAAYARAMTTYSRESYGEAARELERLVRSQPELADARLGLGMAYERLGQPDRALAEYHQALRLDPSLEYAGARLAALGG